MAHHLADAPQNSRASTYMWAHPRAAPFFPKFCQVLTLPRSTTTPRRWQPDATAATGGAAPVPSPSLSATATGGAPPRPPEEPPVDEHQEEEALVHRARRVHLCLRPCLPTPPLRPPLPLLFPSTLPPRGAAPSIPSPSPPHLHTRCLVKCQTQFFYRICMICC